MATLTAIFTAQDNLSKAMQNAGNAGNKTSGIMQKLGKIGSVAMKGIITAVAAAGTALLAFGKKAVSVGMSYESSMSQVMATMGLDKSTDEGAKAYETLSAAAEHMGATTAFSTTEAADALNYLALAGYDAEKAAAALPTVLYLAGAGAMDLASASDMLTDAMSALQIEATQENLTEFSDKLAKTASSSNTSVAQLGEAVLAVGGTAANLKGGITELTASLGILADAGIKGAEGGTHLRNMINSLQSGRNKAATQLFKKMGFSAYDAEGNMRSLGDQFKDINAYLEGMDAKGVDDVLRTIFKQTDLAAARAMLAATSNTVESLGAIVDSSLAESGTSLEKMGVNLSELAKTFDPLATQEQFAAQMMQQFGMDADTAGMIFEGLSSILNGTGTRFDELTDKIDDSAGACEQMYRTMLDNLQGDIDIFNSTVEALYIEIFKATSGTLRDLVQTGTGYMQRLIDAFKEGGFSGLASELGNVLGDAVGVLMSYAPKLIGAAVEVVSSLVDSLGNNADTIANAAVEIAMQLGSAILKIVPKLAAAFVKVIAAASKALVGAIPNLFKAVPDSIYNALGLDKSKVVGQVSRFATYMKASLSRLFKGDFLGAADWLGKALNLDEGAMSTIKGILTGIGNAFTTIKNAVAGVLPYVTQFLGKFANAGGVEATIAGIAAAFAAFKVGNVVKNISKFATGLKKAGGIGKSFMKVLAANKILLIAAAIAAVVAAIVLLVKNWDKVKGALKGGIDKVFGAGTFDKMSKSLSKVGEGFKKLGGWAKDSWGKMKSAFSEGYKNGGLFGGISAAFSSLKESLKGVNWSGIWDGIKNTASDLWGKLKTVASGAFNKVKAWFQSVDWKGIWNKISSTAADLWNKLKTAASTAVALVKAWFQSIDWAAIWNKITSTASALWGKMKTAATTAVALVKAWFQSIDWAAIWNKITSTAAALWGKLKTAASTAVALVKAWFQSIDWSAVWNTVSTTAITLWNKLKGAASAAVALVKAWFMSIDWSAVWTTISNTAVALWGKMKTAASTAIAAVKAWFSSIDWSAIWNGITRTLGALWGKLKTVASVASTMLKSFFTTKFSGIGEKFGEWFGGIQTALEPLQPVFESIGQVFSDSFNGLSEAIQTVKDKFAEIGPKFSEIGQKLGPAMQTVGQVFLAIGKVILGVMGAVATVVVGVVNGVINAIAPLAQAIAGAFGVVLDVVSAVLSALGGDFQGAWESLKSAFTGLVGVFQSVVSAITGFFSGIWNVISTVANSIGTTFASVFSSVRSFIQGIFTGILNGIIGFLNSAIAKFESFLQWAAGAVNWIPGVDIQVNLPEIPTIEAEGEINWGDENAPEGSTGISVGADTSAADAAIQATIDQANAITFDEPELTCDTSSIDAALEATSAAADTVNEKLGSFEAPDTSATTAALEGVSSTIDSASESISGLESSVSTLQTTFEGIDWTSSGTDAIGTFTAGIEAGSAEAVTAATTVGTDAATAIGATTMNAEGTTVIGTFAAGMTAGSPLAVAVMTALGVAIRAVAQAVNLTAQGSNMLRTLTAGMNSGRSTAISSAQATGSGIRSAFASINLYSVGSNIVAGLRNGMNAMFSSLLATARSMAAQLKSTIQSGMQVHSPSRFTDWVGRMTGEGMVEGLEGATKKVTAAAAAMAVGVTSAFAPVALAAPEITAPAQVVQEYTAATPTATASPYDTVAGNSGDFSSSTDERHIVLDIRGGGRIEVDGMTKEQAIDLITEQLKPQLQNILAEEIFTGGKGSYEF